MNDNSVIDFRDHPFFMVTKEVIDNDDLLDRASDVSVYAVLCMYADNRTKTSHPRIETIAKKARCSARSAQRSLKNLEKVGYISIKPRYDSRGHRTSNQYLLLNLNAT